MITKCESCKRIIQPIDKVDPYSGLPYSGLLGKVPNYCVKCNKPYPWAKDIFENPLTGNVVLQGNDFATPMDENNMADVFARMRKNAPSSPSRTEGEDIAILRGLGHQPAAPPVEVAAAPPPDVADVFARMRKNAPSSPSRTEGEDIAILRGLGHQPAAPPVEVASAPPPDKKGEVSITQEEKKNLSKEIFVVHGHDGEMKEATARVISELGLKPIILDEKPNEGKTIIEKFEKNADVQFAVILLSPDDVGRAKSDSGLKLRARQNVIFELGYFVGKLGRKRVFVLKRDDVEVPTDFSGVVYTPYDAQGGWKASLARELQAVGYKVDANKVI